MDQATDGGDGATDLADAAARCWERLDWDSDFFGFGVGSVDLTTTDAAILGEVDRQAAAAGITCLYGRHDGGDSERSILAQEHGYRLVEAAMLFDITQVDPPPPCPPGVEVRKATPDDREAVLPIVDRMAAWSRYAADPRFGSEAAVRMQRAWLDRSIDDPTGDRGLLVAEETETGELVAFVGTVTHPVQRIDAVGTTRKGSGSARYLVERVRRLVDGQPLHGGPIAARNVLAQRFVAHSGLRVRSVEYLYHRWLDDPA